MYQLLTDVPVAIRDFYFEETVSEATGNTVAETYTYLDESNTQQTGTRQVAEYADVIYVRQISRPETKAMADLERVIALGKPSAVINKFAAMVAQGERWTAFDNYQQYLFEKTVAEDFNAAPPVIGVDDNGDDVLAAPVAIPDEPILAPARTGDQVLVALPGYKSWQKTQGSEINGVKISLNEANQTGISSVLKAVELAAKHAVDIFPVNFSAETASGNRTIVLTNQDEFELFALKFMAARQPFFQGG